ncbi:uncharacterized protein A4U43_C04F10880 [Asparagus officinalis]|uniref:Pectinesterase inhibitor domain-containing protein n=1 Tax=Asparagus officinalis TaxID=4686 RepID=A0A5P1F2L8_ASPOF|nr:uncharacterized protein A4U43_C04F10880 [Asparagus officinalis]
MAPRIRRHVTTPHRHGRATPFISLMPQTLYPPLRASLIRHTRNASPQPTNLRPTRPSPSRRPRPADASSPFSFVSHLLRGLKKSTGAWAGFAPFPRLPRAPSHSVTAQAGRSQELTDWAAYGSARLQVGTLFFQAGQNAQTWVSAALTDESTCLDSLAQDSSSAHVRGRIRERILKVAQVTSNALALLNRLQGDLD